jgi:hypothetical protein
VRGFNYSMFGERHQVRPDAQSQSSSVSLRRFRHCRFHSFSRHHCQIKWPMKMPRTMSAIKI